MNNKNSLTTMASTAFLLLAISTSKVSASIYKHTNQCETAKPINYIDAVCSEKTATTMMFGVFGEMMLVLLIPVIGIAIMHCARESYQCTKNALNESTSTRNWLSLFGNSSQTSETSVRTPLNHDLENNLAYGAHGDTAIPEATAMGV